MHRLWSLKSTRPRRKSQRPLNKRHSLRHFSKTRKMSKKQEPLEMMSRRTQPSICTKTQDRELIRCQKTLLLLANTSWMQSRKRSTVGDGSAPIMAATVNIDINCLRAMSSFQKRSEMPTRLQLIRLLPSIKRPLRSRSKKSALPCQLMGLPQSLLNLSRPGRREGRSRDRKNWRQR